MGGLLRIADSDPPAQPIDTDRQLTRTISEGDPAAARTTIGVEPNIACAGVALLASDRQQRDRQLWRELPRRFLPDAEPMRCDIELERDRPIA